MIRENSIREISKGEEKDVRDFLEANLGIIDRVVFNLSLSDALRSAVRNLGATLIAVYNEHIVGTVSLRIVVYGARNVGLIDAFAVDKNIRGKGIGKRLIDEAISWFERRECDIICATADRFNSPSWNIFLHKGFLPYKFQNQLKDLGPSFIRLWITELYILGGGTFFLRKTTGKRKEVSEKWHLIFSWLGLTIAWILAFRQFTPINGLIVLAVVGLSVFTHELLHRLAARFFQLKATFKSWDSGIIFSTLLAIVGVPYPSYGQTYVKQLDFRYEKNRQDIGLIYAVGPIVSLVLAAIFSFAPLFINNDLLLSFCAIGYVTNQVFAVFNLLPIEAAGGFAWDGRRIYNWKRPIWIALVVALALLIIADRIL